MKYIRLNTRIDNLDVVSMVDDEDYDYLVQFSWSLDSKGYAKHLFLPEFKNRKMHRLIMDAPSGVQVDHINGNKLDNRRSNLRLCNNSQNQMNKGLQSNNTSGYKGVTWRKDVNKWRAQIFFGGKNFVLGNFENKKDAAKAYNQKALELHGEFAKLNDI